MNYPNFVCFVLLNFLTAKDTKYTKEEAQRR